MSYTHINLTSQERMHENDDDVVVVLSMYEANLKFLFQVSAEILKILIVPKDKRHSVVAGTYYNHL